MRSRTLARSSVAAAAAAILLAVTACSAPGTRPDAAAACGSPGVTPDRITLGFVYSDSGGAGSAFSSARAGFDARISLANAEGGVHGRRIVYQWRDDESSGPVNAKVTEGLIRTDSVFGLVMSSAVTGDSLDYLTGQGVPVTGLAAEPAWAGHANMFSYMYSASPEIIGRYIQAGGGRKVALVTSGQSAFSSDIVATYSQHLQALGLTVVAVLPYSATIDNPDRTARQIAESGADSLLGITAANDFADVVQATRRNGLHLAVSVALSGYDRSLLATSGPAPAGVSLPVFFRPFEAGGPAIERYRAAMTRYAPETVNPEQQFAMFTYISADMFLRGLDLAGPCPTRAGFIKALRAVPDYDAGGLVAPVDLRDNAGKPIACHAFVQVGPSGTTFDVIQEELCAEGSNG
ncbi:ABC-type branched-chain amino acid transport systems periplasmic component-like protein [Parafrankia sp. Ea1.12]|uniref:ABC transporter substrate-binding protein n=1 Tax=Parafrankia sp. Ea1.12 TaxID=573499 RepID=UPI000DA49A21|nr:ABC transporter substrate-binding protein [Parafrankia sp. Ea1.12]SQD96810.1 ABC-type branched-chain amino acid transport systems periplasmic component-like protein [Parafrankia sp. Ea1.12]